VLSSSNFFQINLAINNAAIAHFDGVMNVAFFRNTPKLFLSKERNSDRVKRCGKHKIIVESSVNCVKSVTRFATDQRFV
jgi:hypothetical protein